MTALPFQSRITRLCLENKQSGQCCVPWSSFLYRVTHGKPAPVIKYLPPGQAAFSTGQVSRAGIEEGGQVNFPGLETGTETWATCILADTLMIQKWTFVNIDPEQH
jgi:hypothetical protein